MSESRRAEFEPLVVEHHYRLRAFVRSLGVDPDWVDDIAQEAFLTAYREWESFDQSRDFGKWLRGIAANIVRNEIRKDGRRSRIFHTELADVLLKRAQEGGMDRGQPAIIVAVSECVDRLTATCQSVVRGKYERGETAPELAERLGLTADNVRQMLVRIRRQVKRCVEARLEVHGGTQ